VGEESSSKCEWTGAEERHKEATREIATRWARLLMHCKTMKGHYPKKGALIL
jgi:hypothetical protein